MFSLFGTLCLEKSGNPDKDFIEKRMLSQKGPKRITAQFGLSG
jgi:hypothetical protein